MRALSPGIGAFLELEGGERLGVEAAHAVARVAGAGAIRVVEGRLLVAAEGALELERRQARRAGARWRRADYLRGHTPPARVAD